MAKILKTDGSVQNLDDLSLASLQAAVGGYIEYVPCKDSQHYMYINEDGKQQGLPVNWPATKLANLFADDYIVGDAVLLKVSEDND